MPPAPARAPARARTLAAALLLLGILPAAPALGEPSLGRVFYSPQERRALEALARDHRPDPGPVSSPDAPMPDRTLFYNGAVRRSDGPATGWVNGRDLGTHPLPGTFDARLSGVDLLLSSPLGRSRLAPGEGGALTAARQGATTGPQTSSGPPGGEPGGAGARVPR